MENVVLVAHNSLGTLFAAEAAVLQKTDSELGELIFDRIFEKHGHLLDKRDLERFKEVFVDRHSENDIQITIMGDETVLYLDIYPLPILKVVEPDPQNIMAKAVLAV